MPDVPPIIAELVERFERNRRQYTKAYNEAQTRTEFIDPFFEALGWDMTNRSGYAEAYKDVIHEDAIKVGGSTEAPDYAFRIGGTRKFFVEAKKPEVSVEFDNRPAYQLRRYSWSAKLPLAILTNFMECAVYDCRFPPKDTDKASLGRIIYLKYSDYMARWSEIAGIFAKEEVLRGSFDRYAESTKGKRGTAEVDTAFLAEIEQWRTALAHNLALRNQGIGIHNLNFAVQRIIDRIIFLRMCEDRGIEVYGSLQTLANGKNIYPRLCQLFLTADDRYNSGLFHFKLEKARAEGPDELTLGLKIDDKVLKDILGALYYPTSPYEFSVIGSDILGNVYEQFLGKVIVLKSPTNAIVEEKPEVKKAGGVYYTPTYIVDYIVKNTVGKLCEGKTPKQVSKLRILDPACGSGSFLIGAYTCLLAWHRDWYVDDGPDKHKKEIYQGAGGQWYLTSGEKKRILLGNIYGVDIDSQAVEVTKLNLLLKVLEGETQETVNSSLKLLHERALPDLGNNIKCGNSLIGSDFFDGRAPDEISDEERSRINAFDWDVEFADIMKSGGFDAVIGNPPYGAAFSQEMRHWLSQQYHVPVPISDSFVLFLLRALQVARPGGLQSFIVPSPWLYMPSYADFRKALLSNVALQNIVLFRQPVFAQATVETCIEVVENCKPEGAATRFQEIMGDPRSFIGNVHCIDQEQVLREPESNLSRGETAASNSMFIRIGNQGTSLGKLATIVCGLTPYRLGKGNPPQSQNIVNERAYDARRRVDATYRQYIMGRDFHRYAWQIEEERWISYGDWLAEPRYKAPFNDAVKIVVRQTADSIIANLDACRFLSLKNIHNIRVTSEGLTYHYLLGLLNSRLISWWYQRLIPERGRVFAEVKVVNLQKLPMRTINFDDPEDKARHDRMVKLVESMLALHKQLPEAKTPDEKTRIQRQIDATDRQIDALVYELYGLTEEEIRIVEEAT